MLSIRKMGAFFLPTDEERQQQLFHYARVIYAGGWANAAEGDESFECA